MNETKEKRLEIVNKLIEKISSVSRRFFYNKSDGSIAYFKFINNRLYFIDDYTKAHIYAYGNKYFNEFSHGGTLQALVLEFSEFIRTGGNVNGKQGYAGLHCQFWGYDKESQDEVIAYAKEIGYLKEE
ncbi:hypothetical protein CKN80_09400 [Carnobacterium divergens]|uniref:hypothetical protein n=1 Tax=Carnobacterium divergens TaxID=2748 RepID=UPI0010724397|nr:hypothetical protein [Carnobacterium divergens]TFJ43944.1 hypothetical protein CKN79_07845 [Carnobacterium divergens]TFJ51161.1 hypothetical protein CKN80_09400 [Carnobacterium divergens]